MFKDLEDEADEDYELDKTVEEFKRKGGRVMSEEMKLKKEKKKKVKFLDDGGSSSGVSSDDEAGELSATDSDDDSGSDFEVEKEQAKHAKGAKKKKSGGLEIVPKEKGEVLPDYTLSPLGL